MTVKNASTLPKRYYGLHMMEGVAEYREGEQTTRIFLNEVTVKKMDRTFEGLPVFVGHVEEVDVKQIHNADGYVVKSFYNPNDGKHWVEFLVTSDRGHQAIANGWKLSNAYIPTASGAGGMWHGVEYDQEVLDGMYEHLAIVDNPRYAESIILTPDEFKAYNDRKSGELLRLANSSSKEKKSMFKFFKREKVENAHDLENTLVFLPESKTEITVSDALKLADKVHNMHGYANPDHMVKINDDEMSVAELVENYGKMCDKMKNMEDSEKKENEDHEEKKENEDKEDEKKENEDHEEKKENEDHEEPKKKENGFMKKLKNAPNLKEQPVAEVDLDRLSRGKARYGSGN